MKSLNTIRRRLISLVIFRGLLDDPAVQALRRKRAATLARDFLQQMHALGMTPAEVEALLRETEASEKE